MALKENRLILDDDQGYSETFYNIKWITYKNGMLDIMTDSKHIVFRDNYPTLSIDFIIGQIHNT